MSPRVSISKITPKFSFFSKIMRNLPTRIRKMFSKPFIFWQSRPFKSRISTRPTILFNLFRQFFGSFFRYFSYFLGIFEFFHEIFQPLATQTFFKSNSRPVVVNFDVFVQKLFGNIIFHRLDHQTFSAWAGDELAGFELLAPLFRKSDLTGVEHRESVNHF